MIREGTMQMFDRLFQNISIIDVNVTDDRILLFIDLNDPIEKCFNPHAGFTDGGYDWCSNHPAQTLMVELVASLLQFVIDIECNDHPHIHVDQLGREIEVSLQIGGVQDVQDDIGLLLIQMMPDIQFFGRVSREGIGSG